MLTQKKKIWIIKQKEKGFIKPLLQDKTKHPCSNTYPIKIISGDVREEGEEYKGSKWFPVDRLPDEIAYGHRFQILKTLEQLKKFNGLNEI